ncbi:hypothetical protein [Wolbachia endosymbiont of Oedothorax gibbosus]|uniref:hypothetical protein n=1 Tax=Wolbachia endosymbiont of Oedothorax gibbosus TaxID=931100 RepID=UPI002023CBA9|nr:hypothetical protein [Wolbachia endosymbiont of Oedothorax gibbosus]
MANMKLSTNFVKHNKWCHPSASFSCHPSAQTLGSSFLYKFTKSASFYNAKPIFTKPNALLAIKFPGSQCLGTGMTGEGSTGITGEGGYSDDRLACHPATC